MVVINNFISYYTVNSIFISRIEVIYCQCSNDSYHLKFMFIFILAKLFSRREFSFTVQDDVYIRFQAFKNLNQLMTEMKRLNPHKIDIGAIYNVP